MEMPNWLLTQETYIPPKDRDTFVQKTLLSVLSILSTMRNGHKGTKIFGEHNSTAPAIQITGAVFVILFMSLSKNMTFTMIILCGIVVRLSFMQGKSIILILKGSITAMIISIILLVPAAILGNYHTLILVSVKVFVSVTLIGIVSHSIPWNAITAGLKSFHVPDVIIFTLDITLKYIMLLGQSCFAMLQTLKVRSIGRNSKKTKAMSGILGVTFLKSKAMSDEMYCAMECRGFDGKYIVSKRKHSWKKNLLQVAMQFVIIILFFALEGYL